MNIGNVGGIQGPQPVQPNRPAKAPEAAKAAATPKTDAAEISIEARLLDKLHKTPEIRQEKVDALRAQIEAGTYETPERLRAAVEKMFEEEL